MSQEITLIQNYINGEFLNTENHIFSDNPATAENHVKIPKSTEKEADLAISAAFSAQKAWSKLTPSQRATWIDKIAEEFSKNENLDFFAEKESEDQGKLLSYARAADVNACLGTLKTFSKLVSADVRADTFRQVHFPEEDKRKAICYTNKSPVGVCTIITPWNYPLYMVIEKLIPCIIYGNTAVVKPSEITSSTAFHFAKLLDRINFPKGVVNFLFGQGSDIGNFITTDSRVKAVAFTGSPATGKIIAQAAGKTLKKVSLECGGKNPAIIFEDADFEKAVELVAKGAFTNNGEICLCMERVYVEKSIYEKFLKALVEHVKNDWKIGLPNDPLLQQYCDFSTTKNSDDFFFRIKNIS